MIGIGIGLGIGFGGAKGSTTPPIPVPVNSVAPVVSGNTLVGSVLSCTTGTWSNSPTAYAYQWRKAGVNIGGQTANTYTSVVGDVGAAIDCVVTASNAGGAGTPVDSNDIVVTAAPAFAFANLAALFNGGAVDGIMIDLTNKDTLFQDVNGTLPVVNNADPVGLALDQHKWGGLSLAAYRAAQPEKVTNGDFAANVTGWTVGSGHTIGWSAGTLQLTAGSGTPYFNPNAALTTVVGRWYEVSFDWVSIVGGSGTVVGVSIGTTVNGSELLQGTSTGPGNVYTRGVGTYRFFFKATTTTTYFTFYGRSGGAAVTTFDNISLKEIDGHHATQASTARPLWQSATSDVLFDGSNDYLRVGDFDFPAGDCFMAAWVKSTLANRAIMGISATNRMNMVHQTSGNLPYVTVGTAATTVGVTAINDAYHTVTADKNTAAANIIVDGVIEGTKVTPGTTATTDDVIVGGQNSSGTPATFMTGNIKRIVAGQVRVQDTMTAADFHSNLIAA